jgi:hypothetical protein
MGGVTVDLLPGDVELARRAAGGDGAAFVHLYDNHSADVFEALLAATGEVETAADATQSAFLMLLRRPPAMDAPKGEVAERLRALALGAGVEAVPTLRSGSRAHHAPAGAGVGWLRSETVAKAGERFDEDWSVYLSSGASPTRRPVVERVASERPLVVATPAPVEALPPLETSPAPPHSRRRWLALPSPAVAGVLLLLALFAGATAAILAGAGGGERRTASQTIAKTDSGAGAAAVESRGPRPAKKAPARAKRRRAPTSGPRIAAPAVSQPAEPVGTSLVVHQTSGGARVPAVTRRPRAQTPQTRSPVTPRAPAVIKASPPDEPATTPAPAEPAPPPTTQPAPAPPAQKPPNPNSGGANRNCNSKKAPC